MEKTQPAQRQLHPFEPVWDARCSALILGSFPSVRSRAEGFYYGNPQNRFWRVTAAVWHADTPQSIAQKRSFMLGHETALWDVLESCEIRGSSDASITAPVANDIAALVKRSRIERIYANGKAAYALYMEYQFEKTGIEAVLLPSTSPANAAWSLQALIGAWGQALTRR